MRNSGPQSARSTGANRQRRSLSRRPTSSTPIGISVPPWHRSRDEADEPAGLHRLEAEHDDVGEADVGREPDRVRVAGDRRIAGRVGRHRLDGEAVRLDHPVDLLGVRDVEVGQLHACRPYPQVPAVPSPPAHVPVPAVPSLAGVPPPGHRRDRDDGEPRVLAAAPPRRAQGAQRRGGEPGRPAAGAARRRAREPAPTRPRSSGGRSRRRGRYLPDEQLTVVNRSQNGLAGEIVVTPLQLDDGRILLVSRGFVPLQAPIAARADRRGRDHRPAASRRSGATRAGSATRRRAT